MKTKDMGLVIGAWFVLLGVVVIATAMVIPKNTVVSTETRAVEMLECREVASMESLGYSQQVKGVGAGSVLAGAAGLYSYTDDGNYVLLLKNPDGSYVKGKIPEDGTYIYEENSGYYRVEKWELHDFAIYDDGSEKDRGRPSYLSGKKEYVYKLYVPQGSVVEGSFDLNLPGDEEG